MPLPHSSYPAPPAAGQADEPWPAGLDDGDVGYESALPYLLCHSDALNAGMSVWLRSPQD